MRVLGVNAVFHDPAAALVVDGQVVARTEHDTKVVPDDADVEVLTAVQGG